METEIIYGVECCIENGIPVKMLRLLFSDEYRQRRTQPQTREEALGEIESELPLEEKLQLADCVDGSLERRDRLWSASAPSPSQAI